MAMRDQLTLYDLSVLTNAVERQRKRVTDEYVDKVNDLDRISAKLRRMIDALQSEIGDELRERDSL